MNPIKEIVALANMRAVPAALEHLWNGRRFGNLMARAIKAESQRKSSVLWLWISLGAMLVGTFSWLTAVVLHMGGAALPPTSTAVSAVAFFSLFGVACGAAGAVLFVVDSWKLITFNTRKDLENVRLFAADALSFIEWCEGCELKNVWRHETLALKKDAKVVLAMQASYVHERKDEAAAATDLEKKTWAESRGAELMEEFLARQNVLNRFQLVTGEWQRDYDAGRPIWERRKAAEEAARKAAGGILAQGT